MQPPWQLAGPGTPPPPLPPHPPCPSVVVCIVEARGRRLVDQTRRSTSPATRPPPHFPCHTNTRQHFQTMIQKVVKIIKDQAPKSGKVKTHFVALPPGSSAVSRMRCVLPSVPPAGCFAVQVAPVDMSPRPSQACHHTPAMLSGWMGGSLWDSSNLRVNPNLTPGRQSSGLDLPIAPPPPSTPHHHPFSRPDWFRQPGVLGVLPEERHPAGQDGNQQYPLDRSHWYHVLLCHRRRRDGAWPPILTNIDPPNHHLP